MAYDGSGNFTRLRSWTSDRDNGIKITAVRHDEEDDGFADAFNQVALRNGVAPYTGDQILGGNKVTDIDPGAVATPSITFSGDAETGFSSPSPGVISGSVGGVERFRFGSYGFSITAGYLGVNTNSPRTALDVVGIASFEGAFEKVLPSATVATGTVHIDYNSGAVLMFTANASANWTFNVRGAAGVALDDVMAVDQMLTLIVEVPQGATAYRCTGVTVDGNAPTQLYWQGGAPTEGNPSSIDTYMIRVIKIAADTFKIRASLSSEF